MADCGCRIVSGDERTESAPFGLKIEYCPLHAAAEQMRDALKKVAEMQPLGPQDMSDCGCRIRLAESELEADSTWGGLLLGIARCPLHAAAGQMRDALARAERALACSERWNTTRDCFLPWPVNVPCRLSVAKRAAREALAAAEAK